VYLYITTSGFCEGGDISSVEKDVFTRNSENLEYVTLRFPNKHHTNIALAQLNSVREPLGLCGCCTGSHEDMTKNIKSKIYIVEYVHCHK